MKELNFNTAFTMSKKSLLKHGLKDALEPAMASLAHGCLDDFSQMVADNLQDEGNVYQVILTIKCIDKD
jgi:hypothetical protein